MLPTPLACVDLGVTGRADRSSSGPVPADAAPDRTPLDRTAMPPHAHVMKLRTATIAGMLLFAASFAMLWAADEAVDATAVAGGTGIVIAGALLGLTFLAWRWRAAEGGFVRTVVDQSGFYEELAAFDTVAADDPGFDDAAAV